MNRPNMTDSQGNQIYYSPTQWEAETGEKMLDTDRVWGRAGSGCEWILGEWHEIRDYDLPVECVVARPGQPKPPEDYRP